jgi:hypothetical protein
MSYNKKNAKKAENYLIQGDVCGMKIVELPSNVKPIKSGVIALGEATGHNHVVEHAKMFSDDLGNLFALVEKPTMLMHQEHAPWILDEGVWQFGKDGFMQVEYDGSEERAVRD